MSNPTAPIIAPPQVYRFVKGETLDEVYATVQCSDYIKDGDVMVLHTPEGLTVGFVYHSAWVATTFADRDDRQWDKVDNLAALVAGQPEYLASYKLAEAVAQHIKTDQDRQRAQNAWEADLSDTNRQWAQSMRRHTVRTALAAVDRRGHLRDDFVKAQRAYHEQLRVATSAVIADYLYENSHEQVPMSDLQALLEARCWFHQPPMELRDDTLVAAYALVGEADEADLVAIGYDLSDLG